MLELLLIIAVIVIMIIAIRLSKKDNVQPKQEEKIGQMLVDADQVLEEANHLILLSEVLRQAEEHGDTAIIQAVSDMKYDGPLPEKLPDGSFTSIYNDLLDYNIAGINYREGIAAYVGEFEGYLQPDNENEYDPNAIAIYAKDGHHLGFIPAKETDSIRALGVEFPIQVRGKIEECYDEEDSRTYYQGVVYV
jgi:hypothetical protein